MNTALNKSELAQNRFCAGLKNTPVSASDAKCANQAYALASLRRAGPAVLT
jgi:hypothetical protein